MSIATSGRIATAALALAMAVAVAARPVEAQQPAPVRVPTSVLERYVGEYVYPDGNTIRVVLVGETLFREAQGQRAPYVPLSETLFTLGPVFTAEFVAQPGGGMTQVLTDGVGVEFRLGRKGAGGAAPAAAPPAVAAVRVPRAVLQRYVGVYDYVPGQMNRTDLSMEIRLRGDTLTRQMTAGQEIALVPLSETRFRVGGTNLMVEFVVDDTGVMQVLGTGFQQMLARLKPKG